jgi:protein-disulfide isomerase
MRVIRDRFVLAFWSLVITVAFLGMGAAPAVTELGSTPPAEVGALWDQLEQMKTAIDNLIKEPDRIKQPILQHPTLSLRPPEIMVHVNTLGNPMLGNPEAPLTLIEFSDYQCPYCRRFFEETLPALKTEYVDTG